MSSLSAVLTALELAITDAGGVRALARAWGMSPTHLSNVRHHSRLPSKRLLAKLGYTMSRTLTRTYTKTTP